MIRSSSLYGVSVGFMGVAVLLSAHLLIQAVGPGAWSDAVVAQAVGTICGAVSFLGWQSIGPSLVAMHRADPTKVLAQSIPQRALAFACSLPLALLAVFAITRHVDLALGLIAAASALPSLGCAWYFIGLGQPWNLVRLDTLPQAVGILGGALAATVTGNLLSYAGFVLAGAAMAPALSYLSAFGSGRRCPTRGPKIVERPPIASPTIRHGVWASWAGLLTSYSPILFTATLLPAQLPVIALADRLFRFGLAAFAPLLQTLQAWVPSAPGGQELFHRARLTLVVGGGWGVVGGLIGVFTLGDIGAILSSGSIGIPVGVAAAYGLMYAVLSVGQVTALVCLVPLGKTRTIVWSTALGAAIVVSGALAFVPSSGLPALLASVLIGESCAVGLQTLAVLRPRDEHARPVRPQVRP